MVMSSTSLAEGKGFPTDTGVPMSLNRSPLKVTELPGSTELLSMGNFVLTGAQPRSSKTKKDASKIRLLLEAIIFPPFAGLEFCLFSFYAAKSPLNNKASYKIG
jgi:hypothetical protein